MSKTENWEAEQATTSFRGTVVWSRSGAAFHSVGVAVIVTKQNGEKYRKALPLIAWNNSKVDGIDKIQKDDIVRITAEIVPRQDKVTKHTNPQLNVLRIERV